MIAKAPRLLEKQIQSTIIDYLRRVELGGRVATFWRCNSGLIRREGGNFGAHAYVIYYPARSIPTALLVDLDKTAGGATSGRPDIEGVLSDGRYFSIEVKRGKGASGRVRPWQKVFKDHSAANGLLYLMAYHVDDVIDWLDIILPKGSRPCPHPASPPDSPASIM